MAAGSRGGHAERATSQVAATGRVEAHMRPIVTSLAGLAAAGGLLAPGALGQGAKPQPGCAGLYSDRKGDAEYSNLDLTGFWFKTEGGKATANLRVANLDRSMPDEATAVNWYVLWKVDDVQHFVQAQIELPSSEPTFSYGTVVETPNGYLRQSDGDTPGQFIEGPDGVISMEIPEDVGGATGTNLRATLADTKYSIGIPGVVSSLRPVDDATGKPYVVGACEAAPPPAPEAAPPAAPPAPNSSSGREVAAGRLDASVSRKVPRARKVKRSLTLTLRSRRGISGVDAALYQGATGKKKVVGKGRLASARGKKKLRLKLSKKLRKGAYTLYLVGRNADGTVADKTVKLKFR